MVRNNGRYVVMRRTGRIVRVYPTAVRRLSAEANFETSAPM
jgi:hypothetical protein